MAVFEDAPFKIVGVPGSQALERLKELRQQGSGYPVLMGDQKQVETVLEIMQSNETSFDQIIQQSAGLDLENWKSTLVNSDPDYYHAQKGTWPLIHKPNNAVTGFRDVLTQKPYATVYIGIIPVKHSWEVPAYLKMGAWNDCPEAQVHTALFKKWEEQYGAKVVTVGDIVEFEVEKPPQTKAEAETLAMEQFIYCPDNVLQGTGDLAVLADALLGAKVWYFWWD